MGTPPSEATPGDLSPMRSKFSQTAYVFLGGRRSEGPRMRADAPSATSEPGWPVLRRSLFEERKA
jgi:hypothetical protein